MHEARNIHLYTGHIDDRPFRFEGHGFGNHSIGRLGEGSLKLLMAELEILKLPSGVTLSSYSQKESCAFL